MSFSYFSTQKIIDAFISQLGELPKQYNRIPNELQKFLSDISYQSQNNNSILNNSNLVVDILSYISKFDENNIQQLFNLFDDVGIGNSHSLWHVSIALQYEHARNYIHALDLYIRGFQKEIQPMSFLENQFNTFKDRMLQRLYKNYYLNLGELDNVFYAFNEGGLVCRYNNSNNPAPPKYQVLEILGYDPSKASEYQSPQSFSKSYDDNQRSLNAKNTSFYASNISNLENFDYNLFGTTNVQEINLSPTHNDSLATKNQNNNNILSPTKQFQLQFAEQSMPEDESFYSAELLKIEPKPILKKNKNPSSINSKQGVKFNRRTHENNSMDTSNIQFERKSPRIIQNNEVIEIGTTINISNYSFQIEKKIGTNAFFAIDRNDSYVIKKIQNEICKFNPKHPSLFCLPVQTSPNLYITHFEKLGSFDNIIALVDQSKKTIHEEVSLFFLLQLLLIVDDLESKFLCHGNICPQKLLIQIFSEELPKEFDINNHIWQEAGIKLCACDEIHPDEGIDDRKAIAQIFYYISTKKQLTSNPGDPPKRWNMEIWNKGFQVLQTKNSLRDLIQMIQNYLSTKVLSLRSYLSRLLIDVSEKKC